MTLTSRTPHTASFSGSPRSAGPSGPHPSTPSPRSIRPKSWAPRLWALWACSATALWAQPSEPNPHELTLGPHDLVQVHIDQAPQWGGEWALSATGRLQLPPLGAANALDLQGLTETQAALRLVQALAQAGLLQRPRVSLRLLQVRGRQVKVLGWVQRPGAYAMERHPWRLSDALAAAGGPLPASDEQVRLRRLEADGGQGTSLQTLNLRDLREQVQTQADPVLVPGDVIWVGPTPQVHVQGEVLQPGPQSWQEGDTVARALARAGQSRLRASAQRLQLIRQGSSGSSGVQVLEQPSPSSPLQPGDVLVLSDRGWP